jgi:hypothetical protein
MRGLVVEDEVKMAGLMGADLVGINVFVRKLEEAGVKVVRVAGL